jgi:hypothetical protein
MRFLMRGLCRVRDVSAVFAGKETLYARAGGGPAEEWDLGEDDVAAYGGDDGVDSWGGGRLVCWAW